MRAVRALLAAFALLAPAAACDSDGDPDLPDDPTYCLVNEHCAEVSVEGALCCAGVCIDCYVDSDTDGTSDCADPDFLDGACLAD